MGETASTFPGTVAWIVGALLLIVAVTALSRKVGWSAPLVGAVDAAGLCTLVQRWTDGAGVASSLCGKLSRGDYATFSSEVSAQSGKKISADHAAILLRLVKAL